MLIAMFRSLFAVVFLLVVRVLCWDCSGINAINPQCKGPETAYEREYFYVGGRYVYNATTNSTIMTWEMYVEKLTPPGGATQPHPIILMTAGVPSGAVSFFIFIYT